MESKECFGSIQEISVRSGVTFTQTRPECRDCDAFRDCLRQSKEVIEKRRERDELRKENMINHILDLSEIHSNELGSCLLEFLSRIYSTPFGSVLFKNLLLFHEIPQDAMSFTLTVPMSQATLDLIQGREVSGEEAPDKAEADRPKDPGEAVPMRIILFQKSFSQNREANMGLIAYEMASLFSSDNLGVDQILEVLSGSEIDLFKRMDPKKRADWLMERWGFKEELEALKKEMILGETKK